MTPSEAHNYAIRHNTDPGFDIKHYQEIACKDPREAYAFARDIPGANIEYCQTHACKDHDYAYVFALIIPGANVNICKKLFHKQLKLYAAQLDSKFNMLIIQKAML